MWTKEIAVTPSGRRRCRSRMSSRGKLWHNNYNLSQSPGLFPILLLLLVYCFSGVHGFETSTLPVLVELDAANTIYGAVTNAPFPGSGIVDLSLLNFTISPSDLDNANGLDQEGKLVFDVVLVKYPDKCSNNTEEQEGCSWTKDLGIGLRVDDINDDALAAAVHEMSIDQGTTDDIIYCCTKLALAAGLCDAGVYGRLILRQDIFEGQVRDVSITVPVNREVTLIMEDPHIFFIDEPGNYALLMANCNLDIVHSQVVVDGYTVWLSEEDELQQFFQQDVPFYAALSILYAILLGWYLYLMRVNIASRISLEEWIRLILVLGLLDSIFGVLEFTLLEHDQHGTQARVLVGFGSALTGIKHGLSRSLLLMLSLGWGVVYPSLNSALSVGIITLGIVYCVLEALQDFIYAIGQDDTSAVAFMNFLFFASFLIDVLFLIWIPLALCNTMKYLKESNQLRKLERYRKLLYILVSGVLLIFVLFLLIFVDAIVDQNEILSIYNLSQGTEINFFLIMLCVAILWKPNPMAREFAYAMELSSQEIDGDVDNIAPMGMNGRSGGDLELTENSNGNYDEKDLSGSFTIT